jgi:hypothetical protein
MVLQPVGQQTGMLVQRPTRWEAHHHPYGFGWKCPSAAESQRQAQTTHGEPSAFFEAQHDLSCSLITCEKIG